MLECDSSGVCRAGCVWTWRYAHSAGMLCKNGGYGNFPGGPVVKNLPADTGDASSAPVRDLTVHMPDNRVHTPQLQRSCATTKDSAGCDWDPRRPIKKYFTYIYTHLYAHAYTHIGIYTHTHTYVYIHIYIASQVVLVVKSPPAGAGDTKVVGSIPGSGRVRQPTPVSLPGESHWQRSLVGHSQ